MAYQPKSYRKFVAGTVTAAVVASAVASTASAATFPDVSSTDVHAPAINELTEKGIIKGLPNGTFNPTGDVTRGQVAIMFARILPGEGKAEQVFTDVPVTANPELVAAAYEVKAAGVMTGANGYLYPSNNLTRQQMAKVLVEAFDLKATGAAVNLKDLDQADSSFREYISILAQNGVTVVADGNYRPTEKVSRAQFATFVSRAMKLVDTEVKVDGVSATNAKTLTVTGANLDDLTAADITVADNTVTSYTATADGKTATVTLGSELVVDEVTKVTVKDASFDVTYKVEADTVEVEEVTYDDDTKDQFVAIKVNGKRVTSQELISAGYDLEFEAFTNKSATESVDIFDNPNTGELVEDLTTVLGDIPTSGEEVYVKVKLIKGSEVLTSKLAEIKIKNIDLAADSITEYELLNRTTGFEQNSTTLVTGETAEFSEITVKSGSDKDEVASGFTVKSSDASVISVNKDTNVLTAQGPGTATITITYGGATYTKAFTVKNDEREATKVDVDKSSVTVVEGSTKTVTVKLLDQYGDPMEIIADDNLTAAVSDDKKVRPTLTDSDEDGESELTLEGLDTGSATITFREGSVKIGTTSVKVTVTDNGTLSKYELKADTDISDGDLAKVGTTNKNEVSTDTTLDLKDDKYLKVDLKAFNSAGAELAKPAADEYEVKVFESKDGVLPKESIVQGEGFIILEAGTKAGTATITVTNLENRNIQTTFKVTVEEVGYDVTGATFKNVTAPTYAQLLNYEDFLSYTKSANDPVISGLKLSKSVAQPIRLDVEDADAPLYIDKDGNGALDGDDVVVGYLELSTTGTVGGATDADYSAIGGVTVATGDDGTVIFKVLDSDEKVVATKAVSVDF